MSEQFQRVEPTPFSTPEHDRRPPAHADDDQGARWMGPALALLVLLALVVVFLLPKLIDDPTPAVRPTPEVTPATAAPGAGVRQTPTQADNADAAASPFADAVEAKARSAAQDLLAELLDVQDNLIERGAEQWAADEMAAVASAAQLGDERYREREFDAALEHYDTALMQALVLEQSIPERFSAQLQATETLIEALSLEEARAALATARLLQPGDPALQRVEARVDALPGVTAALEEARGAEDADNLEAAAEAVARAAELDDDHQRVARELERIGKALTARRYSTAMSEGYVALEGERFDRARSRFERAAELRPGSTETAAALTELEIARTAATLRTLKSQGESLLDEESWSEAIDVFEEALAIDSTLRFAREGLALAKPRAKLSTELDAILEQPGRLVDDTILSEAEATVSRAQQIDAGPRLSAQITEAQRILAIARTPVPVTLRSDGQTAVTVYKVARLGTFTEQQLALRPGTYTAVGTRRGFRDARREFTVTAGGLREPVTIACSEAI